MFFFCFWCGFFLVAFRFYMLLRVWSLCLLSMNGRTKPETNPTCWFSVVVVVVLADVCLLVWAGIVDGFVFIMLFLLWIFLFLCVLVVLIWCRSFSWSLPWLSFMSKFLIFFFNVFVILWCCFLFLFLLVVLLFGIRFYWFSLIGLQSLMHFNRLFAENHVFT